jgi:hypothetical protein
MVVSRCAKFDIEQCIKCAVAQVLYVEETHLASALRKPLWGEFPTHAVSPTTTG